MLLDVVNLHILGCDVLFVILLALCLLSQFIQFKKKQFACPKVCFFVRVFFILPENNIKQQ